MRARVAILLSVVGLSAGVLGCDVKHQISYSETTPARPSYGAPYVGGVLAVVPLQDYRRSKPRNYVLFNKPAETRLEGDWRCINSERKYQAGTVANQVTMELARRIRSRRIFASVVVGNRPGADYYLSAKLAYFYGNQELSMGAAVGASFGLIGALASTSAKTDGRIFLSIEDVVVTDSSRRVVARIGTISESFSGEMPADAACAVIYKNVNGRLPFLGDKLARALAMSIKGGPGRTRHPRPSAAVPAVPAPTVAVAPVGPPLMEDHSLPCNPPCRGGYLCSRGNCVSPCNPPCAQTEICTRAGRCIPGGQSTHAY